jgi:hypothetical protein
MRCGRDAQIIIADSTREMQKRAELIQDWEPSGSAGGGGERVSSSGGTRCRGWRRTGEVQWGHEV